jgi:hypothetical protein
VIFLSRESIAPKTIVMHELTHAAVCTDAKGDFLPDNMYYNSVTPEDHEGIYAFTEIWGELLYRNPKLGKWLASH